MSAKVVRNVEIIIAASLILVGLRFTSVGVGPGHIMQDDGYSVTGGFMILVGGFVFGKLSYERGDKSGKAKKRS